MNMLFSYIQCMGHAKSVPIKFRGMHACRLVELHADTKFKLLPCEADPCVIKSEGFPNTFWRQDIIQLIYFLAATGRDIDLLFHRGQELVTRSLQNMPILVFLKLSRIYLTRKKKL